MTFEFKLPDIGEGIVEGEIVKWLVREGEEIVEDQPMVEVMTDKATVMIPSPRKGRVRTLHGREGELARVHQPLVTLEVEGSASAPPPASHAAPTPSAAAAPTPAPVAAPEVAPPARVLATPVTRRIAREHGIALARVEGTGPAGRVLKNDVLRLVAGGPAAAPAEEPRPGAPAAAAPALEGDRRLPLRGLRRAIARKMVESKRSAPHYTFVEEVDATELKALRERINRQIGASAERKLGAPEAAREPSRFSFLPFIGKALIATLRAHPNLNANFDEAAQELVVRAPINLGIAVATEDGLVVPVVKDAQARSLRGLGEEIARLAASARARTLKPEDFAGGTFTITSLGEQGGLFATPIINHPEVAILGVHRMRPRPVVRDGAIVVREMMYLSFAFDHRVVDGAVGAAFAYDLIRRLENPELLLLDL